MRPALGFAIAAAMIVSSVAGAVGAPRHANHSSHGHAAHRPGTIPVLPYGARDAFGAIAPTTGQGCDLRPFGRDCDKRGPW